MTAPSSSWRSSCASFAAVPTNDGTSSNGTWTPLYSRPFTTFAPYSGSRLSSAMAGSGTAWLCTSILTT